MNKTRTAVIVVALLCLSLSAWGVNDLVRELVFDTDTSATGVGVVIAEPDATGGKAIGVAGNPLVTRHETTQPVELADANGNHPIIDTTAPSNSERGLGTHSRVYGTNTATGQAITPLTFTDGRANTNATIPAKAPQIGALLASDSAVTMGDNVNYSHVSIQICNTFAGTVQFETSNNAIDYYPLALERSNDGVLTSTTTAPGMFHGRTMGKYHRVRFTDYTSGRADLIAIFRGN